MEKEAFTDPNGTFVENEKGILTFVPKELPPQALDYDEETLFLISEASNRLGALSAFTESVPNPKLFIRPFLHKEVIESSKIEGTQATLSEVLLYEASSSDGQTKLSPAGPNRIREVMNGLKATEYCIRQIESGRNVSLGLIKEANKLLLSGVYDYRRPAWAFRDFQVFIGKTASIGEATFIPPAPREVPRLLSNLDDFVQNPPKRMSPLIHAAAVHYQFEAIHPFGDGNGRMGRLLTTLLLYEKKLLAKPILFLSEFFEKNREEYYRLLLGVSRNSDWKAWLAFFLRAVSIQSEKTSETLRAVLSLKEKYRGILLEKRSQKSAALADLLFSNPYITAKQAKDFLKVTFPTAQTAIRQLMEAGIIEERKYPKPRRRNKIYVARELLKTIRN